MCVCGGGSCDSVCRSCDSVCGSCDSMCVCVHVTVCVGHVTVCVGHVTGYACHVTVCRSWKYFHVINLIVGIPMKVNNKHFIIDDNYTAGNSWWPSILDKETSFNHSNKLLFLLKVIFQLPFCSNCFCVCGCPEED